MFEKVVWISVKVKTFLSISIALFLFPLIASAQTSSPAVGTYVDQNGIDLFSGQTIQGSSLVSIGSGSDGLAFALTLTGNDSGSERRSNYLGMINYYSSRGYVVSIGDAAEEFTLSGSTYSPKRRLGSTLTKSGNIFTYTTSSGAVALFDTNIKTTAGGSTLNKAHITSLTTASGRKLTFTYITVSSKVYLRSVQNNLGFQLKLSDTTGSTSNVITAINDSVDYCSPTATLAQCNLPSGRWAEGSFVPVGSDALTTYYATGDIGVLGPGGFTAPTGHNTNITYSNSKVATVTSFGGVWTYAYSDANGIRTTTVTDPEGGVRIVNSNIANQTVLSDRDESLRTVTYEYDAWQRATKITNPNGSFTELTYDIRGNVTQIKQSPASGGLTPIITTASYPASCSNPKTCNKPIWTRNANGSQTDYTYSSTHGGLLTVTAPSPGGGQARPQTRYSYVQLAAKVKNSSGALIDAAPVWRMGSVSTCSSGGSCVGTANETIVSQTYDATRNLFANASTVKAGNNSVSSTTSTQIDWYGSPEWVDGPLPGSADRTYYKYDNAQRLAIVAGPDPDGNGPLKHRALRYADASGQRVLVNTGTMTSPNDWSSFTILQRWFYAFDSDGRIIRTSQHNGSNYTSLQQTNYDDMGRTLCTALRMNADNLDWLVNPNSTPVDACNLSPTGSHGADRITKLEYNAAGQVINAISGYGTSAASATKTEYYPDGNVKYLIDGKNQHTYYQYDGFGRLSRQYYPDADTAGLYNVSDFQQYDYDGFGRQYRSTLRDGQIIDRVFDDLGRVTQINAPGTADDISYTYDNFGRMLTAIKGSNTITSVYDAFGRKTSETGANGTVSYEYDAAGRGSKITYPGSGLFVNYDYDNTGAVTRIRENGATSGLGVLATYEYDDFGRRTKLTRGNGVVTNTGFDTVSRLTSLQNDMAGTADDQTLTFTHNVAGQIATKINNTSKVVER
ncbi:MAG: hypothetical protein L3J04_00380 [Robiginitomaculum sp.]|nr:hypothetical protein [Robiginitomaculum sp.]